jgi:hypothetical protein
MTTCNKGVDIPILLVPECGGDFKSTKCSLHPDALPILNLPTNTSNYDIIIAQNLAIQSNRNLIDAVNNVAQVNTTTVALTLAQLTVQYPTAIVGAKVKCENIILGKLMYEKTLTGWISYTINTVI